MMASGHRHSAPAQVAPAEGVRLQRVCLTGTPCAMLAGRQALGQE